MAAPPKSFGRRNAPQKKIEPPPIIYHAPQGLGGEPASYEPRRLRSIAVIIGVWGLTSLCGVALFEAIRHSQRQCDDPNVANAEANCPSGGGGHGGGGGHYSSSGDSGSGQHSVAFGGFGATGESGVHGGGFGGFHGGGE